VKIERIGYNKLKVTVSREDLLLHGLSFENFAADSPRVQDFFWDVLRRAENETDLVMGEGHVVIEAMPLKNEGLVIFLTKPDEQYVPGQVRLRRVRYRAKSRDADKSREFSLIYRFESFDDLCAFAHRWRYMGESSSLYALENHYILLFSFEKQNFDKRYVEAQILEFARPERTLSTAYLEEHAHKICDGNAIASILRYFKD